MVSELREGLLGSPGLGVVSTNSLGLAIGLGNMHAVAVQDPSSQLLSAPTAPEPVPETRQIPGGGLAGHEE